MRTPATSPAPSRRHRKLSAVLIPAAALAAMLAIAGGMVAVTFFDLSPRLTVAENDASLVVTPAK